MIDRTMMDGWRAKFARIPLFLLEAYTMYQPNWTPGWSKVDPYRANLLRTYYNHKDMWEQ